MRLSFAKLDAFIGYYLNLKFDFVEIVKIKLTQLLIKLKGRLKLSSAKYDRFFCLHMFQAPPPLVRLVSDYSHNAGSFAYIMEVANRL